MNETTGEAKIKYGESLGYSDNDADLQIKSIQIKTTSLPNYKQTASRLFKVKNAGRPQ